MNINNFKLVVDVLLAALPNTLGPTTPYKIPDNNTFINNVENTTEWSLMLIELFDKKNGNDSEIKKLWIELKILIEKTRNLKGQKKIERKLKNNSPYSGSISGTNPIFLLEIDDNKGIIKDKKKIKKGNSRSTYLAVELLEALIQDRNEFLRKVNILSLKGTHTAYAMIHWRSLINILYRLKISKEISTIINMPVEIVLSLYRKEGNLTAPPLYDTIMGTAFTDAIPYGGTPEEVITSLNSIPQHDSWVFVYNINAYNSDDEFKTWTIARWFVQIPGLDIFTNGNQPNINIFDKDNGFKFCNILLNNNVYSPTGSGNELKTRFYNNLKFKRDSTKNAVIVQPSSLLFSQNILQFGAIYLKHFYEFGSQNFLFLGSFEKDTNGHINDIFNLMQFTTPSRVFFSGDRIPYLFYHYGEDIFKMISNFLYFFITKRKNNQYSDLYNSLDSFNWSTITNTDKLTNIIKNDGKPPGEKRGDRWVGSFEKYTLKEWDNKEYSNNPIYMWLINNEKNISSLFTALDEEIIKPTFWKKDQFQKVRINICIYNILTIIYKNAFS